MFMEIGRAPAVRARSKTRASDSDEQQVLKRAAWMCRDMPFWLPVLHCGRVIGEVCGDPERNRTLVRCAQSVPYASYDTAVTNKSAGKHYAMHWSKLSGGGVANNWYDLFEVNCPSGNYNGTANIVRQFDSTDGGAIYNGGAVSPSIKYLTRASVLNTGFTNACSFIIYDRVLSYDKCPYSSSSMTNTGITVTRYISNGDLGLQAFLAADSTQSSTASNLTAFTYVNQAGTGSRLVNTTPTLARIVSTAPPTTSLGARNLIQCPGSTTTSSNPFLPLQVGDQGMQQVTNYTWSVAPAGTFCVALMYPIAFMFATVNIAKPDDREFVSGLDAMNKRIYDDACLSLLYCPSATTAGVIHGWMEFGW